MLKRSLIFVHRWLGVALCVLFLLWFPSGIGMMYFDFPGVSPSDRLERSPQLDPATIALSPGEAAETAGISSPAQLRLASFDGRPAYRFGVGGGEAIVYADTGEEQIDVSNAMVHRAAAAWTGLAVSDARVEPVEDVDQWTVQGQFRTLGPLRKYSWSGGDEVYVSQATGEVVQHTTTASRIGAYLGPIPHWFYFTPLRRHGPEWSQVVIYSSAIGTVAAIIGVVIGAWMYSPRRQYRSAGTPSSIPYHGQKRWHMLLGLVFGVFTATWAFSGMLSMDPFPSPPDPADGGRRGGGDMQRALRDPLDLTRFEARHPREALAQLAGLDVRQLELVTIAGEPMYLATLAGGDTRIVRMTGAPESAIPAGRIVDTIARAAAPFNVIDVRTLDQYDAYYLDRRRERPLPVVRLQIDDEGRSRYYVDPATARVVGSYNSGHWVTRWVYHGLHSLDFPWLYNYRPAWDIVVIAFMIGGTALCVTSLVLAWRVVGRTLIRTEQMKASAALVVFALVLTGLASAQTPAPAVKTPTQAETLAKWPWSIAHQTQQFKNDAITIELAPKEGMEYKYRLEKGAAVLYSWTSTGEVHFELHSVPDGSPQGYAEWFATNKLTSDHGVYNAQFTGLHGWWFENQTGQPITIRLSTSGFFTESTEFRRGKPPLVKQIP
ncbi:MAG: hypothetical protein FJW14_15540 [Acidimicrobiia bacterium]|nr:hypothetical protein [Acidimicrobiia bacterium]